MAFMRAYSRQHQGDPSPIMRRVKARLRTMRAGRLIHANAGDPFKFGKFLKRAFKPPKAIRKLTIGKAISGLGKVASFAAPFIPGIGPLVSTALGAVGGGPGPVSEAPELMEQQPVGQREYTVPGIEVSAPRMTKRRGSSRFTDFEEILRQLLQEYEQPQDYDEPEEQLEFLPEAEYEEE
jgi:hypothetical protein